MLQAERFCSEILGQNSREISASMNMTMHIGKLNVTNVGSLWTICSLEMESKPITMLIPKKNQSMIFKQKDKY